MRPRLNPEVRYVPCPDGVYLRGPSGARTLKGELSYQWVDKLAPYLTGEHTLDDLTAALPGPQRENVEKLVALLLEHGFVADVGTDQPHTLTPEERRTYAAEISFIAAVTDSAEHRFQRHREARVAVLGSGPVADAVVEAGLRSGLANMAAADADIVLQCSASVEELIDTARSCRTALGQVLVTADAAWLTEVGRPADTSAEAVWERLRTTDPADDTGDDWLTGPVPALVAAQLVLACFRHSTGLDALPGPGQDASTPTVTRFDLRTLDTTVHSVVTEAVQPARDRDELLARTATFVDRHTGVLAHLDEDDLPQFPIFLCRAVGPGAHEAFGWGIDQSTARFRAVVTALDPLLTAGFSRDAAVEWALRRQLESLLAVSAKSGPIVELAELPLDERGRRLAREWEILRQNLVVTDLSGVFELPAYAFRLRDKEIVTCAATAADALTDGLERLLVAWQTATDCTAWPSPPAESAAPQAVDALTAALDKAGYRPVVHDRPSNGVMPFVVQVVLDER